MEKNTPSTTFLLYSDADDLWNTERTTFYNELVNYAVDHTGAGKLLTYVSYPTFVRAKDAADSVHTPADVDRALTVDADNYAVCEGADEHWLTATPLGALSAFVKEANASNFKSKCADVYFNTYVRSFGHEGKGVHLSRCKESTDSWQYFYRTRDDSLALRDDTSEYKSFPGMDRLSLDVQKEFPTVPDNDFAAKVASNFVLLMANGGASSNPSRQEWLTHFCPHCMNTSQRHNM